MDYTMNVLQCPVCHVEMEKGTLINMGTVWKKGGQGFKRMAEFLSRGGMFVYAYRCPKCGKIELTTAAALNESQ